MDLSPAVLAVDVTTAKQLALVVVAVLGVGAVVCALVIRSIVTKLLTVAVLAVLAIAVWSQRSNLQSCADRVRAADGADISCTFFGVDVDVPE